MTAQGNNPQDDAANFAKEYTRDTSLQQVWNCRRATAFDRIEGLLVSDEPALQFIGGNLKIQAVLTKFSPVFWIKGRLRNIHYVSFVGCTKKKTVELRDRK